MISVIDLSSWQLTLCCFIFVQVANKLYPLDYASEHIEHFAKSLLLSVVDQRGPEAELKQENSNEERKEVL